MNVASYIKELIKLSSDSVYSMPKIEWWLLKHEYNYSKAKQIEGSKHLYEIEGEIVRLPDNIDNPSPEEKFIDVYNRLNELTELHRKENYFKKELAIYKEIKNSPELVEKWIIKNERFVPDSYPEIMPYLDYNEQGEVYRLSVFFLEDNNLEVIIDKDDFKYNIAFLEVF